MIEFLKEMTQGNWFLWFHMLAGGALAIGLRYIMSNKRQIILMVFAIAVLWEILEVYIWGWAVYGNDLNAFADALGDVLGAVIIAMMVTL